MNIFVARLNFDTTSEDLREAFEEFGVVDTAKVIMDHFSGKSRGFGFVEMPNEDEARAAINDLNDSDLHGNTIVVKKAEDRKSRGGDRRGGYGNRDNRDGGYGNRDNRDGGYGNRDNRGGGYGNRDNRDSGYGNRDNRDSGYGNDRRSGGGYGGGRRGGNRHGGGYNDDNYKPRY